MAIQLMIRQVPINVIELIEVTKSATVSDVDGDGVNSVGDIITYTISVNKFRNSRSFGYSISDTLTDGNSTTLSFTGKRKLCIYSKENVFNLKVLLEFLEGSDPNYNGTSVAYIWSGVQAGNPEFYDDYYASYNNWSSIWKGMTEQLYVGL